MKRHWPFFAPVAQWLEQLTHNQLAVGSSPTGRTKPPFTPTMQIDKTSPWIYPGLHYNAMAHIKRGVRIDNGELDLVAAACCDVYEISFDDFKGKTRTNVLSDTRKVFFHLCRRELYKYTCKRLGMYTGRDHSTITVAVQRAEELLEFDPHFRVTYNKAKVLARQRLKINGYEFRKRDQTSPHGGRAFER